MRQLSAQSTLSDLSGVPGLTGLAGLPPEVTVTLAPDCQEGLQGLDGNVPLVGYLVLAPAGTQLTELLAVRAPDYDPEASAPRRADPEPRPDPSEHAENAVRRGLDIDLDKRTVAVDGVNLSLTYLEFELLAHLVRHPHRVYTREQLVATIWGYGPVGDQWTVDVHVARLRRKLGAAYRERIVTIRRVGYKYVPAG
jgi:hypothetical protein